MGTVAKAMSLLNLFTPSRTTIGLSELARLSGVNKATVYRLMQELQTANLVEQVGSERTYRLGAGILRLAALREAAVPILTLSREFLERLSSKTGETAHMSIIQDDKLISTAHAYSPRHAMRVMMENAQEMPFHATASGLAILAFSPDAFVERILSPKLSSYTSQTVADTNEIRERFRGIREDGIAEAVGMFEHDVHSHAAPIFGSDGQPMGALAVAAPASRMNDELRKEIRAELRDCALLLTRAMGGTWPSAIQAGSAA